MFRTARADEGSTRALSAPRYGVGSWIQPCAPRLSARRALSVPQRPLLTVSVESHHRSPTSI